MATAMSQIYTCGHLRATGNGYYYTIWLYIYYAEEAPIIIISYS